MFGPRAALPAVKDRRGSHTSRQKPSGRLRHPPHFTTLRSPRIVFPAICVVLVVASYVSWASSRSKPRVRAVSTIPLQLAWQSHSAPIDISSQETLLVFPWGLTKVRAHIENRKARRQQYRKLVEQMKTQTHVQEQKVAREPRLLVWDYQRQQAALEFPKSDEWASWQDKAPESLRGGWQFRFQGDGSRIVAIQTPWLVLIDAKKQSEIGRALPSESYLRKDCPGGPSTVGAPISIETCHLAVDPRNGSVAVVYNIGKDTHLYVYGSDLKTQISSCQLPRMVRDLSWSPDGKELAVLFEGRFDEDRMLVSVHLWTISREPDVWLVDPIWECPWSSFGPGQLRTRSRLARTAASSML